MFHVALTLYLTPVFNGKGYYLAIFYPWTVYAASFYLATYQPTHLLYGDHNGSSIQVPGIVIIIFIVRDSTYMDLPGTRIGTPSLTSEVRRSGEFT